MHVDLGRCFLALVSFLRYQGTSILYQGEALNVLLPTLGSYFSVKKNLNSECAREKDRQRDREREREGEKIQRVRKRETDKERESERGM